MFKNLLKKCGLAVENTGAACEQSKISYTQKSVVVFDLFITIWFIHVLYNKVYAAFYTAFCNFSDQLGGAFYTLSTTPITTTTI